MPLRHRSGGPELAFLEVVIGAPAHARCLIPSGLGAADGARVQVLNPWRTAARVILRARRGYPEVPSPGFSELHVAPGTPPPRTQPEDCSVRYASARLPARHCGVFVCDHNS